MMNYHKEVLDRIDECLDPENWNLIVKRTMAKNPKLVLDVLNEINPPTPAFPSDECRRIVNYMKLHFDVDLPERDFAIMEEAINYGRAGTKIPMIKDIRSITGLGLKEAKKITDRVFPSQTWSR